jgi:hypothetical protein
LNVVAVLSAKCIVTKCTMYVEYDIAPNPTAPSSR